MGRWRAALVRASGLCTAVRETLEGSGPGDWQAVCTLRRRGEARVIERRFSADDARRARLWGKPGPWSDYPQRMLQMRARAFALRDGFADVLGGLYLREELEGSELGWSAPAPHGGPKPAPPPGPAPAPAPTRSPTTMRSRAFASSTRRPVTQASVAGIGAGLSEPPLPTETVAAGPAPACAHRRQSDATVAAPANPLLTPHHRSQGDQRPCSARRSPTGASRRQRRGHEGGLRAATPAAPPTASAVMHRTQDEDRPSSAQSGEAQKRGQAPRTHPRSTPRRPRCSIRIPILRRASPASRLGQVRRPSPRTALALRYAQHWSIRQPRMLASRRAGAAADRPASTRSAPRARQHYVRPKQSGATPERKPDKQATSSGAAACPPSATPASPSAQPAPVPATPTAASVQAERPSAPEPDPGESPQRSPDLVLTDYDNALCCARDQASLDEIHEEFVPTLQRLGREHGRTAQAIHARHASRVTALAWSPNADTAPSKGLPS